MSAFSEAADTHFGRLWAPLRSRELFLWLSVGLFAHQAIQLLNFSSLSAFANSFATQNFIYWFACFVVLKRIGESADRTIGTPDKILAAGLLIGVFVASLVPYRFAIGLMTTLLACRFIAQRRDDRSLKAAGVVMFALSAHLLWGPILFQFLTPELLSADAALVGAALSLVRPDIVWAGTTFSSSTEFAISLVGACSSFHNLSTALLACAAATMFVRTDWSKRDFIRLAVASAAMILMNDMRLCLLAWGLQSYAFWHDGAGQSLLAFVMTATLLSIAFSGVARQGARG